MIGVEQETASTNATQAHGGKRGRIVCFTGSTPNIGTTLVAIGTAARLAEWSEEPVAYVCLNLKSSKLHRYLSLDGGAGLEGIRAEMRAGQLHGSRLMSYMERMRECRKLHVLLGAVQREQAEFYQPADIRHLLRALRSVYRICVVDVNAYWDNAATIAVNMEADARVAVTTPDLGHFQEDMSRGLRTAASLFGIRPDSFLLAVNQVFQGRSGGIRLSDIRRETGMELAAAIGYDPAMRDRLNQGELMHCVTGHKSLVQALQPLAETVAERLGLAIRQGSSSVPGRVKSWMPLQQGR